MTLEASMAGPFSRDFRPAPKSANPRSELSSMDLLYAQYQDFLTSRADVIENKQSNYADWQELSLRWEARKKLDELVSVLTPTEIQSFINLTQSDENSQHYVSNTGLFITKIIAISYKGGHNDFILDVRELKPLDYIGYNLTQNHGTPLRILVRGTIGYGGVFRANGGVYYIEKSCGPLATLTKSIILYTDQTTNNCGSWSEKSTFHIKSAQKDCGDLSKDCVYYALEPGLNYGFHNEGSHYHVVKPTHHLPNPFFPNCHQLDLSEWQKLWQPAEDFFSRGGFP